MPFQLHPQLAADTHYVTELENCQVLLMNDARFPWLVLVPTVDNIRELYELSTMVLSSYSSRMLSTVGTNTSQGNRASFISKTWQFSNSVT